MLVISFFYPPWPSYATPTQPLLFTSLPILYLGLHFAFHLYFVYSPPFHFLTFFSILSNKLFFFSFWTKTIKVTFYQCLTNSFIIECHSLPSRTTPTLQWLNYSTCSVVFQNCIRFLLCFLFYVCLHSPKNRNHLSY